MLLCFVLFRFDIVLLCSEFVVGFIVFYLCFYFGDVSFLCCVMFDLFCVCCILGLFYVFYCGCVTVLL